MAVPIREWDKVGRTLPRELALSPQGRPCGIGPRELEDYACPSCVFGIISLAMSISRECVVPSEYLKNHIRPCFGIHNLRNFYIYQLLNGTSL